MYLWVVGFEGAAVGVPHGHAWRYDSSLPGALGVVEMAEGQPVRMSRGILRRRFG